MKACGTRLDSKTQQFQYFESLHMANNTLVIPIKIGNNLYLKTKLIKFFNFLHLMLYYRSLITNNHLIDFKVK